MCFASTPAIARKRGGCSPCRDVRELEGMGDGAAAKSRKRYNVCSRSWMLLANAAKRPTFWVSAAPGRRFAVAAIEHPAGGVLVPLDLARAPLHATPEEARHAAGVDAGLRAVVVRDRDRRVTALAPARVHPARVAPARVFRGRGDGAHAHRGQESQPAERPHHARTVAGGHRRWPE